MLTKKEKSARIEFAYIFDKITVKDGIYNGAY